MIHQNYLQSVMPPMKGPERRQTPRKTVERFAYINIEPTNGGSVLNVSEGGLCFHSIAPVQRNKTIHFWFWEHDDRIEVQGELVWMDEAQKKGGLRFTDLPAEARAPMRRWISQPPTPVAANQASALSALAPHVSPALSVPRLETKVVPGSSEPLAVVPQAAKARPPLSGFSVGLAAGLLISALMAAPFLFHSYKRQLGESLIRWGERFAASPHAPTQTVLPTPQTPLPSPQTVSAEPQTHLPALQPRLQAPEPESPAVHNVFRSSPTELSPAATIPKPQPKNLPTESLSKPAKPEPARIAPAVPAAATSNAIARPVPKAPTPVATAAISPPSSPIPLPRPPVTASSVVVPSKPGTLPQLEPANQPARVTQDLKVQNAGPTSQMYFEVGKFKDAVWAYQATDKLAHLGLRATVVQKAHFWANSYHVLVGPYDDDKVEGVREKLVGSGFKPQVFERGSRNFIIYGGCDTMSRLLRSDRVPKGVQMPVEDCVVSWETYSTHAIVKFVQENNTVATADGKWVKRQVRYERDAFVYRKNDDGTQTLLEIQFAGMSHALVFEKSRSMTPGG